MIWRTEYSVPNVYVAESRDFQLIGRVLDLMVNSTKGRVDAISTVTSTKDIKNSLLPLLQAKVGFFSDKSFTDDELRYILDAFPYIIKHKGSLRGIKEALNLYLRIYQMDTHNTKAEVVIGQETDDVLDKYTVHIKMHSSPRDTTVLDEILKYILPTGYTVSYSFLD